MAYLLSHPTPFRLKNDDTDLKSKLQEEILRLAIAFNVGYLIGGNVEDRENYSDNQSTKSKQEHSVNLFILQLQLMIEDTPSMKNIIKAVLTNSENPMGYDLTTPIRKARRIIEIYMQLTQSNALKDTILLEMREVIKLKKLPTESLRMSVRRLFDEIEEFEEEMQIHHKWIAVPKIERINYLLRTEKRPNF